MISIKWKINQKHNYSYSVIIIQKRNKIITKTKTKKPLFYLDNIFNNLLIFNTVQTKTWGQKEPVVESHSVCKSCILWLNQALEMFLIPDVTFFFYLTYSQRFRSGYTVLLLEPKVMFFYFKMFFLVLVMLVMVVHLREKGNSIKFVTI